MTGKDTKKTETKVADLKDEQLDKVAGGFTATDDLWVKGKDKGLVGDDIGVPGDGKSDTKGVSGLDLGSVRVK